MVTFMTTLKLRKTRVFWAVSSSLTLIAGLALVTVFTAVAHARTCAKLTGFPGFLQSVGLVAAGPCVSKVGGTVCGGGNACTTDPGGKAGTCKNVAKTGQPPNCQCVENPVSRAIQ